MRSRITSVTFEQEKIQGRERGNWKGMRSSSPERERRKRKTRQEKKIY